MDSRFKTDLFVVVAGLVVVIGLAIALSFSSFEQSFAGEGGREASACTIFATSTVAVGNQTSTRVTTNYSNNAYVIVQQPVNASNTVYLNFNSSSTAASGFHLAPGEASSTPDTLVFGKNTDFPFAGYVEALTSVGSTTLNITECRY